ncbi:iron ABC transporter [Lottiidibacillus patelloidae]|uniref:Iron ABC transporter n=1 Tax=Lottiidibacillus patelloidae TaxID=2670334 RepID=A0A263BZG8_9BACI|nr:metal ABC transporter permease [Lottiidibacillus patelloidae]OZM58556.1 iron ABC transporter [Lottiidibacillus patelloidae]
MSSAAWIMLTGSLVGISCGIVGCYLILRKMAMLADAISHTVLLGIVLAFLFTGSLSNVFMVIGAGVIGVFTAFLVQLLHSKGIQSDAAIGVVFTSMFAFGVVLVSLFAKQVHLDVEHVLYGEIAYVPWNTLTIAGMELGPQAVWVLSIILVINIILILFFYKEFKISSFDPQMAAAIGVPVVFIHYLLMGMTSLTAVSAFESVGAILVVAMLIVPGAAAYLLTDKLHIMLILSAIIGVLSAIAGYQIAYIFNVSIAGAMASAAGLIFFIVFIASPKHGLIAKRLATRNVSKEL